MLTRCPECATRFRVHEEQLEVAEGQVRCGRCGCLFEIHLSTRQAGDPPGSDSGAVEIMERDPQPGTETAAQDLHDAEEAITVPAASSSFDWAQWKPMLSAAFAALLLLALVTQAVWWQRHALASHPGGLTLVRLLCRVAPCQPQPPKVLDKIEVLERELQPDPDQSDALRFRLRMVNRAPMAQPYPQVELRLLDAQQQPIGVRRFSPQQYLAQPGDGLLDPDVPVDATLELAVPTQEVSGFQLDFF